MKKIIIFPTAIICLTGIALYAQSLGDLARGEQIRRDSITNSIVIVIESPPPELPGEKVSADDAEDEDAETGNPRKTREAANADSPEKVEPYEITDLYGQNESYWRDTMSEARNRITWLEDETKELTSKRNALQLQHSSANGSRRASIKNDIDRAIQDLDQRRSELEQAREELRTLQNQARSSGALPGWIE